MHIFCCVKQVLYRLSFCCLYVSHTYKNFLCSSSDLSMKKSHFVFCSSSREFVKKLFDSARQFKIHIDIKYAFKNGSEYADPKNIWKLFVEGLLTRQLCFTLRVLMSELDYQLLVIMIGTRCLTAFIIPMNLVAWQSR